MPICCSADRFNLLKKYIKMDFSYRLPLFFRIYFILLFYLAFAINLILFISDLLIVLSHLFDCKNASSVFFQLFPQIM